METRKEHELIDYESQQMSTSNFMISVKYLMEAVIKDIDSINKRLDKLEE